MSKSKRVSSRRGGFNLGLILLAGGLLIIMGAMVLVGLHLLGFGIPAGAQLPALTNKIPPEEIAARREKEELRLNSYGWMDKEARVVRIPISQAIVLVADSGLPVGEPTATPTPTVTPTPSSPSFEAMPTPTPAPTVDLANVSFSQNVLPIFEQHCTECHAGDEPREGLRLTSHVEVMTGSFNGSVIEPGDVENSYLIEQVVSGRMPKEGPKLTPAEIEIITAWVEAGAPDN